MTTLLEAIAAQRAKIRQAEKDAATRHQIGHLALQTLGDRLAAVPLPLWSFNWTGGERRPEVALLYGEPGAVCQRVATWTIDEELRLVFGGATTEWITAESCARVIDRAVLMTAAFMVAHERSTATLEAADVAEESLRA